MFNISLVDRIDFSDLLLQMYEKILCWFWHIYFIRLCFIFSYFLYINEMQSKKNINKRDS